MERSQIQDDEYQPLIDRPPPRDDAARSSGKEQAVQLQPVYLPSEDECNHHREVDIIAIHGLDTKSPDTWIHRDLKDPDRPEVNWLKDRDMLPKVVGRARIFTCNWPADLYETSRLTPKTIEECALSLLRGIKSRKKEDQPILFIASCLGGIILMKALVIATIGEYSSIRTATRGIIFLGTPFQGTSFQNIKGWAKPLLGIWASLQSKQVSMLLNFAMPNYELDDLVFSFTEFYLDRPKELQLATFYEKGVTSLCRVIRCLPKFCFNPSRPLVNKQSASLHVTKPEPLNRPHKLMNKFRHSNKALDDDYGKVEGKVEWILEGIRNGSMLEQADAWIRKGCYKEERLRIQRLSGDNLEMDQCYINLAIVINSREAKSARTSSPFSLLHRMKVETPAEELRVELPALFNSREKPSGDKKKSERPRRILIRGAAGVGKTTLCKKIIHDFTQGKIWNGLFRRVLWVPLRNLRSKKLPNFESLLYHEYFNRHNKGEDHARKLAHALLIALITEDERTLYVLDGLDEAQNLGNEENDGNRLLSELLDKPNVIITTRPHAMLPAGLKQLDLELETIGFYPHQIQHYLEKVVQVPHIIQTIQEFLGKRWLIQNLVRIPIQLDALCLAWDKIPENAIIDTMTVIYEAIVLRLSAKDILRSGGKENPAGYRVYALPSEIEANSAFENAFLECFAFSGMYSNIVEFQPNHQDAVYKQVAGKTSPCRSDTQLFHDILGGLSFLRSSDLSVKASERGYHFLHLTFQEFFAARYFTRQWKSGGYLERLDFNSTIPKLSRVCPKEFLRDNKYDSRYDIVWRFTVGLLDPEKVPEFFKELEDTQPDLLGPTHQRLIMHCLSETDILHESEMLSRLEDRLSRWLILECDLTGSARLANESEFPGRAFCDAIESTSRNDYGKRSVLESFYVNNAFFSETTIMKLIEIMQDVKRRENLRVQASYVLSAQWNLPEQVIIKLIKLIQNVDAARCLRGYPSKALSRQSALPQEIIMKLERLVKDQEEKIEIRIAAVEALENQTNLSEDTVTSLITMLHQDLPSQGDVYRIRATLRKQSNLSERIVASLISSMEYESELPMESKFRTEAIKLLETRWDLSELAIVALIQLLENEHASIRSSAASVLKSQSNLSQEALRALEGLLEKTDGGIHCSVAEVFGAFSHLPEKVVVTLIRRIEVMSFDESYTRGALLALQTQKNLSEQSVLALIQLTQNDTSVGFKMHVYLILFTQLQLSEQAIANLEQVVRDTEDCIRSIIAQAPRLEEPIPLRGLSMHESGFRKCWRAFGERQNDVIHLWEVRMKVTDILNKSTPFRRNYHVFLDGTISRNQ
ncbi:armadillo-type protein [Annulohypoxylon nitens]|nr:armadillo-type protein [Annulohypoxylon nitens]